VFDDADELVSDRSWVERRLAAVEPEVRAAHAGQHDADNRVAGFGDDGVASLADGYGMGFVEYRCTHGIQVSRPGGEVRGPARGALTRHPYPVAARVMS